MDTAISCKNLGKSYQRRVREPGVLGALRSFFSSQSLAVPAVSELSFVMQRGERVGLIGENGAGKSTTLKMLTGIVVPSSGELSVLGHVPSRERRKLARKIGVVFGQRPQLLWDIPVRETFSLLKTMYDIPNAVYEVTYGEAVKRLELEKLLGTPVRQLSLGQRMRCDLAAALLHAPEIAFLDEPTIGLDVSVKEQVREFIRDMQGRFGTTLLITTHDLKDITETCQRLLLLDRGSLLFDGSLRDFEKRFASRRKIVIELEKAASSELVEQLSPELLRLGGTLKEWAPHRVTVEYEREGVAPALTHLMLSRLNVADILLEKADIESIVTGIYRRQATSEP
ncbi:MAG TPA: ATP-binding cassette domain-containing protein [Polyangiaceae bacterium]|nr:ATP-binding cassette domain-containing protein [Polyangiaceae bacterium]